ncbi:hypothetical protein PG990_011500 [Apiospora arundinis]
MTPEVGDDVCRWTKANDGSRSLPPPKGGFEVSSCNEPTKLRIPAPSIFALIERDLSKIIPMRPAGVMMYSLGRNYVKLTGTFKAHVDAKFGARRCGMLRIA